MNITTCICIVIMNIVLFLMNMNINNLYKRIREIEHYIMFEENSKKIGE